MKYIISVVLIVTFYSCGEKKQSTGFHSDKVTSFRMLYENFNTPPVSYSTAPLWVWNDQVTEEKIETQLKEFKKQGIHMVFIHPRPGLITEYLSREWFELAKYAVGRAKELDMKIWLYDENSYPSGFAGGHVPAMMPESYNQGAGLQVYKTEYLTPEDSGKYFLILKRIGDRFANITHGIHHYYGQPGDFYTYSKWYYPANEAWFGGWSYVDLLAKGVTEKFIKLTMRDYENTIGEDFGSMVPGIFTDEPNINTRGGNQLVIRWTPDLFDRFEEKYGYQLQTYLPSLIENIGDYKNIRHDYYALLLDLFIVRWAKPWFDYTESKNLQWTGHYWEHVWPNPKHGGDNMAMYAWHQIPGIDMLFNTEEDRPDQFGNVRAVKELSSVANQMGRHRSLSETYGGAGWELSFEDMKRLGDWEYALGVNFMNQHLSHMTIKGARKRDYPQSMSYHTPWWDNYHVLNDYFHRLSFALSSGEQKNRILILEPTSSSWMYFSPIQDDNHMGGAGFLEKYRHSFHSFLNNLEKYQVEYDLGSERLIREFGKVKGGQFIISERAYDLVVLPPFFENFELFTFNLIHQYLTSGGNVLSFGSIPTYLDGNKSTEITKMINSYPEQWILKDTLDLQALDNYFSSDFWQPFEPGKWGGRVFHMRRQLKDGQLLFFTNFDRQTTSNIQFDCKGKTAIQMDPLDGTMNIFPAQIQGENLQIVFKLPPSNSKLFFISNRKINFIDTIPEDKTSTEPIKGTQTEIETLSPNMLTLDYCDLMLDRKSYNGIYFYNAADTIFKHFLKEPYGFNHNPWSVAVQYRTNILDKNRFDSLSGFDVIFPFIIDEDFKPQDIKAVVEWPHLFQFKINGAFVSPVEDSWWLDRSFGVIDLTGKVQAGRNELLLSAYPMDILAELEPVYLLGKFKLQSIKNGWKIIKPNNLNVGSWKKQGYPFYSDRIAYTRSFTNEGDFRGYRIRANKWNGSVAEVWVNEIKRGIIGWEPYEFDISPWIIDGENRISLHVVGSLKNLLGPHHNNPGKGIVTPWSFFYAPEKQPEGDDYDLLDYGLFEEFEILGYKE